MALSRIFYGNLRLRHFLRFFFSRKFSRNSSRCSTRVLRRSSSETFLGGIETFLQGLFCRALQQSLQSFFQKFLQKLLQGLSVLTFLEEYLQQFFLVLLRSIIQFFGCSLRDSFKNSISLYIFQMFFNNSFKLVLNYC